MKNKIRELLLYFFYGLGDSGTGLAAIVLGFYLFPFFSNVAGLSATITGTILMLIRFFDAFADPIIGWLSDNTKTIIGGRIPWMLASIIPLSLSITGIWWVPPFNKFYKLIYYTVIALILMISYTSVNLPYAMLMGEITQNKNIINNLSSSRFTGSMLGGLTGLIVTASILNNKNNQDKKSQKDSYFLLGRIIAILTIILTLTSAVGLIPYAKKATKPIINNESFTNILRRAISNKLFRKIILLYSILWSSLHIMQSTCILYLQNVINLPKSKVGWFLLPFVISVIVGLQIWRKIANSFGRINALYGGSIIWLLSCIFMLIIPPISNDFKKEMEDNFIKTIKNLKVIKILFIIILLGIGASIAYIIPWALLTDIYNKDPNKASGVYTSSFVFIQKVSIGITMLILGIILDLNGYNKIEGKIKSENQSKSAKFILRSCMSIIPFIMILLGIFSIKNYTN